MTKTWSPSSRYFTLGLLILALGMAAYWARQMFVPLIVAGLIAYLLFPAVSFLHTRLHLKRELAANLVYFLALAILIALPATLIPVLASESETIVHDLLVTLDQLEALLAKPVTFFGITFHLHTLIPSLKDSLTGFLTPLPQNAWHLIEVTSKNALWLLIILVGAYYFLTDWEKIREWLIHLAPEASRSDVRRLYLEIRGVWLAYLRGQLTLMIIVGVVFSLLWSLIGLPGALILGILGGLFSIIPDVGPLLATALAVIVALLEGSTWIPWSNIWFATLVAGLYIVLINIKNVWLRPYVLGRSVHMHQGLVFIAIVVAVILTGFLGAFIVVPVLASTAVIGRYLRRRILGLPPFPSAEQSGGGKPSPSDRRRIGTRYTIIRRRKV